MANLKGNEIVGYQPISQIGTLAPIQYDATVGDIGSANATSTSALLSDPSTVRDGTQKWISDVGQGALYITRGNQWLPVNNISPYYFFHAFAGDQIVGDSRFWDFSGSLNSGQFGINLSNATAWGNAGYVTTVTPSGGSTDSVVRMPNLNWDYTNGESIIVWWLGIVATPGSTTQMMGDGNSNALHGINVRATNAGKAQINLIDGSNSIFSGSSVGTPFDGTLHSYAFCINGNDRTYGAWTDEAYDTNLGDAYNTLSSGTVVDTRNSNSFNIGCAAPASAVSTSGTATQTRSLAIFRLPPGANFPAIPTLTRVFQQLRRSPNKLISSGAF